MSVPRLVIALLAALVLPAAMPAAASAADWVSYEAGHIVFLNAMDDERNNISVAHDGDTVTIRDHATGAALTAAEGCVQVDVAVVSCTSATIDYVLLTLGGGDDVARPATAASLTIEVLGEEGDDTIADGPGDGHVHGGAGSDRLIATAGGDIMGGGDGFDVVDYSSREAPVTVTLSEGIDSTGNGEAGENDVIGTDIEDLIGGADDDVLTGSAGGNVLVGGGGDDTIFGGGGEDELDGEAGADTLLGGADNDYLYADDDEADTEIDCGAGDADMLDADNLSDPEAVGCEIIAPEFYDAPEIEAWELFTEGHWLALGEFSVTGGSPEDDIETEWWRCGPEGDCALSLRTSEPGYRLGAADVGATLFALVRVTNEAGGDQHVTLATPVIGGSPSGDGGPLPPPAPDVVFRPPGDYGDYIDVLGQQLAPLNAALDSSLRRLARRWRGDDPRTLARRRRIGHRVTFPETGKLTIAWTAAVGSARAAARRRVTIARGTAHAVKGTARVVRVRPTKRGRALLRRSKRLRVTLSATFVGGAASAAAPAEAKRAFVLRRR